MRNVTSRAIARRALVSFNNCRHSGDRKVGSALASIFLLFGLATQPAFAQLAVTPDPVDMGVAAPGTILERTLTIKNVGTTTAFANFITPQGQFWLQRTTCMLSSLGLAPGETCQAIIRFSAEYACTYHANLLIYGWNGAQPDVDVTLTAAGAAGAAECTQAQYATNGRWRKVVGPYPGTNNYAGIIKTVADLGNDGEMDAIIQFMPYLVTGVPEALWHTERLTEIYVYTYTADGNFIDTTSRWFGVSPLMMPALVDGSIADFNGDGKIDFAWATANEDGRPTYDPVTNENLWYVKNYAFMSTPTDAYDIQALGNISDYGFGAPEADIDGDGDIDILMSGQAPDPNSDGPGGMYMLINDGSGAFTMGHVFTPTSAGSRPLSWPALNDLDGDGDPDLLIGRIRDGSFAVYENVGGTFNFLRDIAVFPGTYRASDDSYHVDLGYDTAEFEGVTGFGIADLDGDGAKDVVVYAGGALDHEVWYNSMTFIRVAKGSPGLNFAPIGGSFSLTQRNQSARAQLLPINGDSAPDAILLSQSGAYPIHDASLRNDGDGQLRYENLLAFPMVTFADSIFVADMNHDGRLDVVYARGGPLPDGAPGERGVLINTTPRLAYNAMSISDVSVSEGNSGAKLATFTVELSQPAAGTVTYNIATANGTATSGSDYVAKSLTGESIAPGQTSRTFSVTINGDPDSEANETFAVNVSDVVGALTPDDFAVGTLLNDDDPTLSIADVSIAEGNSGSSLATFTVSLSKPVAGPVGFDIFTDYGSASPGSDFASNATIGQIIAAGQTSAAFTVAVNGDTVVENHEKFTVNLANVVGAAVADGQAQGRIINDDLAQLSIDDVSVTEGNSGVSTATFVVRLSGPMPNPVTFDIATLAGTATAGSDYVARSQPGRFLDAGRTRQVFEVNINGDTGVEPNETFTVGITNVSGATLADGSGVGTISNDDVAALKASRASTQASSRGRGRLSSCKPSTRKGTKPGAATAGCVVPAQGSASSPARNP